MTPWPRSASCKDLADAGTASAPRLMTRQCLETVPHLALAVASALTCTDQISHRPLRRPRRPQITRRLRHARPGRRLCPRPCPTRTPAPRRNPVRYRARPGHRHGLPRPHHSISDHALPAWRANALGTYRFWRDIGYAAGALVAGVLADSFGLNATVVAAAVLTAASGLLAARWITERHVDGPR